METQNKRAKGPNGSLDGKLRMSIFVDRDLAEAVRVEAARRNVAQHALVAQILRSRLTKKTA